MTVAVVVAVFLILHALQCATGRDVSPPASPASVTAVQILADAGASVVLQDAAPPSGGVLLDGHHGPADDRGVAVAACLMLLVVGGTVLLGALRRWALLAATGRRRPLAMRHRLAGGFRLSQLCVLRT